MQKVELDFGNKEQGRRKDRLTDRCGSRNSYIDLFQHFHWHHISCLTLWVRAGIRGGKNHLKGKKAFWRVESPQRLLNTREYLQYTL